MNKTIYEYPIDTDEIIAECNSCGKKFAPTLKHVSITGNMETSMTRYAACSKCGHRSEWYEKRTRSLTGEERVVFDYWIQDGKYDNYPKAFRDAYCWKKDSPEEIAE
jgi:DNA-directed RNA polymerase subunit RPC12/RpoP